MSERYYTGGELKETADAITEPDKTLNDYISRCVRLESELAEAKKEVERLREAKCCGHCEQDYLNAFAPISSRTLVATPEDW